MAQRYQVTVDVHVILQRDNDILLCLREGTGYRDGWYCLPSGHLEAGETVIACAVREAREEVGVIINPRDLRPATVVHHLSPEGNPRLGVFFATSRWYSEPINAEPAKCAELTWAPADDLPSNTVPYTAAGIELYRTGVGVGVHGWPELVDA
ncbi:NUDIX domain-containing protein [Nonomuraea typhae]|uniref:NUDIX domain-containing protein n=1 Tax=Nonomuraea typhae TaxID=2603600 RepID=A0ABW7YNL5_9ACTN